MPNTHVFKELGKVEDLKREKINENFILTGTFGKFSFIPNYKELITSLKETIANNSGIIGELEHPNSMNINLENVSHKITYLDVNYCGEVTGTIEVLSTPKGKIVDAIIESGLPLFVSPRSVGTRDEFGNVIVDKIITFDLIGSPNKYDNIFLINNITNK